MPDPSPVHRYRLVRRIARGGMAEVYLAAQIGAGGFEKQVALKKILPMYASMEEFGKLFRDEARIAGALNHGNVVGVLDYGMHDDEWYLAMEYVDGPDLEEVLDRCRRRGLLPPIEVVLYVGHRVASALEYAHAVADLEGKPLRIVHRDVSPPNVLLGVHGEVKLADFGVAKAEMRDSLTRPGVLRGKYAYMSPEQVRHRPVDHRSDLFSLGTVLFELLTGRSPFDGGGDYQTMENVSRGRVVLPSQLRQDTPVELDRILARCHAADPDARYADAGVLRKELAAMMVTRELADEPEGLVGFLRELFPERAPHARPSQPRQGHTPLWEGFAHRLSPMLVEIPTRLATMESLAAFRTTEGEIVAARAEPNADTEPEIQTTGTLARVDVEVATGRLPTTAELGADPDGVRTDGAIQRIDVGSRMSNSALPAAPQPEPEEDDVEDDLTALSAASRPRWG